jgi:hypothetical protein
MYGGRDRFDKNGRVHWLAVIGREKPPHKIKNGKK